MSFCNKCGAQLSDDSLFCNKCGAKVVQETVFCEKCGNPLNDGDLFCNKCGKPVENNKLIIVNEHTTSDEIETENGSDDGEIDFERLHNDAENGVPVAQAYLGMLYIDGSHISQNVTKGIDLIQKAAKLSYVLGSEGRRTRRSWLAVSYGRYV